MFNDPLQGFYIKCLFKNILPPKNDKIMQILICDEN